MRRLAALVLAAVLLLAASGCATLFDTEVYSEEPFEAQPETAEAEDAADTISNYAALRRAIVRLVSERAESALLQFQNYDGVISRDISTACWEVKSSTALGSFAVDYISYDLSRIVSFTQAEIHITYKRSAYQMSALEKPGNLAALRSRLEQALRGGESYLVLEITAASLTADTVRQTVERVYYADPLVCPVLPSVDAALYPDSGVTRIVEATLDYGLDGESLEARRAELDEALDALLAEAFPPEETPVPEEESDPEEEPAPEMTPVPEEEPAPGEIAASGTDAEAPAEEASATGETEEPAVPDAERVRILCGLIADACVWDETAGGTAWDALTQGIASSEGMAMALEAACRAIGIDCQLIAGRLDGEGHAWTLARIDGAYYHVDVSRWDAGEEQVFLVGDEDLWGAYWWDTSEYPACPRRFGAEEASGEPSGDNVI